MSDFILTKEYKRFTEFCRACQKEKYIGLCYGPAGVGKSMSATHLTQWKKVMSAIVDMECEWHGKDRQTELSALNAEALSAILYTPTTANTPRTVQTGINFLVSKFNELILQSRYDDDPPLTTRRKNYVELLIIDEADRLQPKSLEQIREIYDSSLLHNEESIAIILIGMPGIEKRLVRFPQLYSRIGFAHAFKTLSDEEVAFIIQHHGKSLSIDLEINDFTNQEAIAAITRITQGNFRLINRLLKQALRVMAVNQLTTISKEVIEAARECLVIGNIY